MKKPKLKFTPTAWAKLLFLRDIGDTEVGGFGVCPNDLLLVEDVRLVKQRCTCTTVEFDDESVANFFDEQVDSGLSPEQFARIWIHTHPGDCTLPSGTDERTFARVFGRSDWAAMFILAKDGSTYCRLGFNTGPTFSTEIQTEVEFALPFGAADTDQWELEYDRHVTELENNLDHFWNPNDAGCNDWPLADDPLDFSESNWDLFQSQEEELDYIY